jgi:hypothetical protein
MAVPSAELRGSGGAARRRSSITVGTLLLAASVVLGSVRLAISHDRASVAVGLVLGVVVTVVIVSVTAKIYRGTMGRVARLAAPGAWVATCIDAQDARAWRAVVIDDRSVRLVDRRNRPSKEWLWARITGVSLGPVTVGLTQHTGVVLDLADGSRGEFLLPSRSLLTYPRELAEAAADEIRRRLNPRPDSA